MQDRKEGLKWRDDWNMKLKYWEGKERKVCIKYKLNEEVKWGEPEKSRSRGPTKVAVEEVECNAEGIQREDGK
jgi:hypothetical protein